jgi:hypothetical protein
MAFTEQLPKWDNAGAAPSTAKQAAGWLVSEKPPADWFNWFMNRTYLALKALQDRAFNKGVVNTDVETLVSSVIETHTRSSEITLSSGVLQKVEEKDGATVVKSSTCTYDGVTGALTSVVHSAGGKTATLTLVYNGNGDLTKLNRAVV